MPPKFLEERYNSLPPRRQNNQRSMFLRDWKWAKGNEGREKVFAEKWGLYYEGKNVGEAMHPDLNFDTSKLKDWSELTDEEYTALKDVDIY